MQANSDVCILDIWWIAQQCPLKDILQIRGIQEEVEDEGKRGICESHGAEFSCSDDRVVQFHRRSVCWGSAVQAAGGPHPWSCSANPELMEESDATLMRKAVFGREVSL